MHLPLTRIDAINQPSEYYLWVQDILTLCSGVLWTMAYGYYVVQGFRDKSYGMPIVPLCANVAWEIIYSVVYPIGPAEQYGFLPSLVIDIFIIYTTVKFGASEWKHNPVVANNIGLLLTVGLSLFLLIHWGFVLLFVNSQDITQASFWSGFACQTTISWSAITQLIRRGTTRGHSMAIWWCRFVGTLCAVAVFYWRYTNYPIDYWYAGSPLGIILMVVPEIAELTYPFVFKYIERQEKAGAKIEVNGHASRSRPFRSTKEL